MSPSDQTEAHAYLVHVDFLTGERSFASETYTMLLPDGHDAAAAAQALSESSPYWDDRVPDLAKRVLFVPAEEHRRSRRIDEGLRLVDHVGRYLVLSTSHIRCASGQLFDQWAEAMSPGRPLAVASSLLGWFVPTAQVAASGAASLPEELPPILAFARSLGCSFILFDYDAAPIGDLPTFPW